MARIHISKEFKVGLFMLTMLAAAVFTLVYIGVKKELFSEKVHYYVVSPTGEKVERGVPVKISGFRIGDVSDVQMYGIDYIKIELKILKKYQNLFTKGLKVRLAGGFPIGSGWIEVHPGPKDAPVLSAGTTLELDHDKGLMGSLEERVPAMLDNVQAILDNVRAVSDQFVSKDAEFKRILANLDIITTEIAMGKGLVQYMFTNPEPVQRVGAMLAKSEQLLSGLNTTVEKASGSVDNVNAVLQNTQRITQDVEQLMDKLNAFMVEVDTMRAKLNPVLDDTAAVSGEVRKATTDLVRLRNQAEYSLKLGTDVLQRLKQTWPLRRAGDGTIPTEFPSQSPVFSSE